MQRHAAVRPRGHGPPRPMAHKLRATTFGVGRKGQEQTRLGRRVCARGNGKAEHSQGTRACEQEHQRLVSGDLHRARRQAAQVTAWPTRANHADRAGRLNHTSAGRQGQLPAAQQAARFEACDCGVRPAPRRSQRYGPVVALPHSARQHGRPSRAASGRRARREPRARGRRAGRAARERTRERRRRAQVRQRHERAPRARHCARDVVTSRLMRAG